MENLFEKFDELTTEFFSIKSEREKCVANIVEKLQKKTEDGFIRFTDETSYPLFYDETINEYESVVGAKAVNGVLYIATNTKFEEDDLCWSDWKRYGQLDLIELVYILEHNLA